MRLATIKLHGAEIARMTAVGAPCADSLRIFSS